MDVNVTPFEIETKTRHGDMVRADVYLPRNSVGPFPVLLGASPYQKSLRHLPKVPATFPFHRVWTDAALSSGSSHETISPGSFVKFGPRAHRCSQVVVGK
jgi:hypothetical protein